jgi:hypothetical protein
MKSARPQTPLSLQTAALLGKPAAFFGRSDGDLLAARLPPVEIADALAERPAGEAHVLGDGHVPAAALTPFVILDHPPLEAELPRRLVLRQALALPPGAKRLCVHAAPHLPTIALTIGREKCITPGDLSTGPKAVPADRARDNLLPRDGSGLR